MKIFKIFKRIRFYSCLILFVPFQHSTQAASLCRSFIPDSIQSIGADSLSNKNRFDLSNLGPFYFPIHGKVISHFGKRGHQYHPGTDIKLNHGDTVRAGFKGIVTRASKYYGYGNLVVIDH